MPKLVLNAGNLPAAIAKTAIGYESKKEFKSMLEDGETTIRYSHVGYKLSKANKNAAEAPMSFAVVVPKVELQSVFDEHDKGTEFVQGLFEEYQDSKIHDVADKDANFDPTDIAALIADYFDNTRNRKVPKLSEIKAWILDVWITAFVERRATFNATLSDNAPNKLKDSQLASIAEAYEKYMLAIMGRGVVSENVARSCKDQTAKLVETGAVDSDDEMVLLFNEKIKRFLPESGEVLLEDAV